ncbi:MAG: hypothetical protein K2N25_07400 [Muribaculaceae bacterium]|nr:hypothetical protein [Muribaculaceae bacterium]
MPELPALKKSTSPLRHEGTRSLSSDEEMLHFDNEADFQAAITQLKNLKTVEEKIHWVRINFGDFKSIQDFYWEAMNEVDESNDDSMESLELFQQKYDGLYFPKYMEDMGFYIPMSDLDKAYLVNRNCEVSIAGNIKNFRDINEYSTLMMLGRAYYSMERPMTIGTIHNFTIHDINQDPVGPEYDSDWRFFKANTTDGTERKVKLKVRRLFRPLHLGYHSLVHLELCFRKKRWCGFTNYNGKANITFKTVIPGFGTVGPLEFNQEGYSSHDYEFPYPIKISNSGNEWCYFYEEVPFKVTVDFNKIKDPIVFEWNMYGLQYVTNTGGYPISITPHF